MAASLHRPNLSRKSRMRSERHAGGGHAPSLQITRQWLHRSRSLAALHALICPCQFPTFLKSGKCSHHVAQLMTKMFATHCNVWPLRRVAQPRGQCCASGCHLKDCRHHAACGHATLAVSTPLHDVKDSALHVCKAHYSKAHFSMYLADDGTCQVQKFLNAL